MALRTIDDCRKEELIQDIPNPRDRKTESDKHLRNCETSLESAEKIFNTGSYEYSIVAGYDAMESIAKSYLALRGFKVKQHECVFLLLEYFLGKLKWERKIFVFPIRNAFRLRIQAQYVRSKEIMKSDAKGFLDNTVKPFVEKIKRLMV